MNKEELIELLKPCEKLCFECGGKCCINQKTGVPCAALKDGKCTQRGKWLCLVNTCSKMRKEFPEICKKLDEEKRLMFPYAASLGIDLKADCQGL